MFPYLNVFTFLEGNDTQYRTLGKKADKTQWQRMFNKIIPFDQIGSLSSKYNKHTQAISASGLLDTYFV